MRSTGAGRWYALLAATLLSTSLLFVGGMTLAAQSPLAVTAPTGSVQAGIVAAGGASAAPGDGYITTFQQQSPSATVILLILLIGLIASVVIMTLNKLSASGRRHS